MIHTTADGKGELKRVEHGNLVFGPRLSRSVLGMAAFLCALTGPAAHAAVTGTFGVEGGIATFTVTGGDSLTLEITLVPAGTFVADPPDPADDTEYLTFNGGTHLTPPAPLGDVEEIIINADDGDDTIDCSLSEREDCIGVEVHAGGGNDTIIGSECDDEIYGDAGNDVIDGRGGDDVITGGPGNDLIRGDDGGDTLGGGGGWDVLDYSTDAGPGGITVDLEANTANDGWGNSDDLEEDTFSAVRGKGTNDILTGYADRSTTIMGGGGDDVITGGSMTDVLFGDAGDDTIEGGSYPDYLFGGTGDDVINGGPGNYGDIICGDGDPPPDWPVDPIGPVDVFARIPPQIIDDGGGDDDITGGDGGDTIYGGGGADRINGDAGMDFIYGDLDYDLDGDGVNEQDTTLGGADRIRGGTGPDFIWPGAGNDIVSGGVDPLGAMSEDWIYGSVGSDTIIGGEVLLDSDGFATSTPEIDDYARDWVSYSYAPAGVTVDLTIDPNGPYEILLGGWAADDGEGGADTLYGIECVEGSPYGDQIWGTSQDNIIRGGAGNDTLFGRRGDDELLGQAGNDVIWGDAGIQFEGGNDFIDGGSGDDVLHGEAGDDDIIGGTGNDTLSGGPGVDTLNYSWDGAGVIVDLSGAGDGTATDGNGDADTIDNCDSGVGIAVDCSVGSGNEFYSRFEIVIGSGYADTIDGYTDWPIEIWGMSGNDILTGGDNDDVIYGNAGNDTIEGGLGDDSLTGGKDFNGLDLDTVTYANAPGAVTVDLGISGPQNTSAAGNDILAEFENLTGSAHDDILIGDAGGNVITGGAGDDILNGRGDQDVTINGVFYLRQDTLDGGAGTDSADYRLGDPALLDVPDLTQAINDGEGGSDVLLNIETVLLPNNALFVSAGPDWTISPGGSVVLQGAATGGTGNYSYVWDTVPPTEPEPGQAVCDVEVPGLDDRCIAQPTASPEETTIYRLTVTDYNPATGSLTVVNSNYVKITVAVTLLVDAGPDRAISIGQSVKLSGSASGGVTPYTVAWSPASGLNRTDLLLPEASPATTTTYTLTVTDETSQAVSDTVTVTVTNPYTVNAGADVTITQGQSTPLNAVVQGGTPPYTYKWSPVWALSSTTVANPVASPTAPQTAYTVTVTDSTGRTTTDSVIVFVTGAGGQPGTGGKTDGGTFPQPQSSPVDQTTGGPVWTFPMCGAGAGPALMLVNALLLMGLHRRRR